MTDSTSQSRAGDVAESARRRREALRRFHFGDVGAAVERPGPEVLPLALAPFRAAVVRGIWPVVIDPEPAGGPFVRSLEAWLAEEGPAAPAKTFADNRARLVRRAIEALPGAEPAPARAALSAAAEAVVAELALASEAREQFLAAVHERLERIPARARLVAYGRRSALAVASAAGTRRVEAARAAFAAEAQSLVAIAEALLEADRERRPDGFAPPERVGRMGALGDRFLDSGRLSGVVGQRRAGAPLAADRRERLELARAELAAFDAARNGPIWLVPAREEGEDLMAVVRLAADPCAAAATAFDEAAAAVARLVRAARLVRLEAADALDPDRHLPWLERLDWRAFSREELALVRPVFALVRAEELLAGGLTWLSRLLLSGRPVQVVLLARESGPDGAAYRFEPAYFGIGHREAFVQQGSLSRPLAFAAGFERALAGGRPGLHVIDAPEPTADELDPWLFASARVSGRAAPIFRYDPEAGSSWARRLAFDENPEPAADWPRENLPGGGEAPFTFGDAALADPAWREHFAAASDDDELLPFAEWLELTDEEAARRLPFVVGSAGADETRRYVADRAVAAAARDRLAFWRTLEELAGVRSEHVEAAGAKAREEAEARAARERAERDAEHERELERLRATADEEAVDRIVAAIFELEGATAGSVSAASATARARQPAEEHAAAPAGTSAPAPASAGAEVAGAAPASEPAEEEEAWVDTALCTSCDECTRKVPQVFVYNGNKQAYVKNPRGAPFRDIVAAAELCTAKIIHPGTPWDAAEPDLARSLERARALVAR